MANVHGTMARAWPQNKWIEVDKSKEVSFQNEFGWALEQGLVMEGHKEKNKAWESHSHTHIKCLKFAPDPPTLMWHFNDKGKQVPYEEPAEASERERALKARPSPLTTSFFINDSGDMTIKIGANTASLVHRATALLASNKSAGATALSTSWRLVTDYKLRPKPKLSLLTLTSNKDHLEAIQPKSDGIYKLRKEQLRALAWIEIRDAKFQKPFVEEEAAEASIPHLGSRLEGRATREVVRPGGVLAFDVAFGKTALALALVEKKMNQANAHAAKKLQGAIPLKATLVVVSNHLTDQWHEETKKFLGENYHKNTLPIKRFETLRKLSIAEFQAADIIIISMTLFESAQYKSSLAYFAGVVEIDEKATGRAKATWRTHAAERVSFNVDRLQEDHVKFGVELKEELQQHIDEAEENGVPVPSKRLRGSKYMSKQGLSASKASLSINTLSSTKSNSISSLKRKRKNDEDDNDDEAYVSESEAKDGQSTVPPGSGFLEMKKRLPYFDSIKKFKANTPNHKSRGKKFGTDLPDNLMSWQTLQSPVFEMFSFSRLVIDGFTYFKGFEHIFKSIQSESRWILSGTFAIGSFTDVKKMAEFLNINLGIDDYSSMNKDDLTTFTKEMTS